MSKTVNSIMNNEPRQKLCELIVEYGHSLCNDQNRCEALLKDYCGIHKREIFTLVSALKQKVPDDMLKSSVDVPQEIVMGRLRKRLEDELAITPEAAHWAVESWAMALRFTLSPLPNVKLAEDSEKTPDVQKVERVISPQPISQSTEKKSLSAQPSNNSAWLAFVSTIIGATIAWRFPLVDFLNKSVIGLFVYSITVLFVFLIGCFPLFNWKSLSPRNPPARAPLYWAFLCFAWPTFAGSIVNGLFFNDTNHSPLVLLLMLGSIGIACYVILFSGIAITMKPPWPKWVSPSVAGLMNRWSWVGVAFTMFLASAVLKGLLLPANTSSPNPSQISTISSPAMSAQDRATGANPLSPFDPTTRDAALLEINKISSILRALPDVTVQPKSELPDLDAAISALLAMHRPMQGNRALARAFHNEGMTLLKKQGATLQMVEILQKAYLADPHDVQIVNDLGYAEYKAGSFTAAHQHLIQALILAPTRTSAWANLAELKVAAPRTAGDVDAAADYFVTAYWFSKDRARTITFLRQKAEAFGGDPRESIAARMALARVGISV